MWPGGLAERQAQEKERGNTVLAYAFRKEFLKEVVFEVMPERRINCLLSLNFVRLG